jgi:hypothetical protein
MLKALLIAGISLFLGFCFDYFFYKSVPGINFPVYIILIISGLFVIAYFLKKQISKQVLLLILPLLFLSSMVFVRSSIFLALLNVGTSVLLLLFITKFSFFAKLKKFWVNDYLKILLLPFDFIDPAFKNVANLFKLRGGKKDEKLSQVIKGVVITLPILFIFILLFSASDLVFQRYLLNIISLDIKPETIFRTILIAVVTMATMGAYAYTFREKDEVAESSVQSNSSGIGQVETAILFGSINVLFFIFILLQLTYLFGGQSTIEAQGFTYADYARRGFFELIAVAVISFALIWLTEKYIAKKADIHTTLFKFLSSALIVQVILIMGSAFKRLFLYEQAYGFTTLRLYSHIFIILLGIIFLLLLYKIIKDEKENTFAFRSFVVTILFLVAINFLNPDAFIARQNIDRFATTGKLDVRYLNSLSYDALAENIKVLNISDKKLKKDFAQELYSRGYGYGRPNRSGSWQSMNLSRIEADKILTAKKSELKKLSGY